MSSPKGCTTGCLCKPESCKENICLDPCERKLLCLSANLKRDQFCWLINRANIFVDHINEKVKAVTFVKRCCKAANELAKAEESIKNAENAIVSNSERDIKDDNSRVKGGGGGGDIDINQFIWNVRNPSKISIEDEESGDIFLVPSRIEQNNQKSVEIIKPSFEKFDEFEMNSIKGDIFDARSIQQDESEITKESHKEIFQETIERVEAIEMNSNQDDILDVKSEQQIENETIKESDEEIDEEETSDRIESIENRIRRLFFKNRKEKKTKKNKPEKKNVILDENLTSTHV